MKRDGESLAKANPDRNGETFTLGGRLDEFLIQKNHFTDVLSYGESKTGIKRRHLFLGATTLVCLYLFSTRYVFSLLKILYPAYASIKAIETPQRDDDLKWLTYWVVYSCFMILESISDVFLSSWFPFYFVFKCIFLGWCMAPVPWNGSEFLYHKFIGPFFNKHESDADILISEATKIAKNMYENAEKEVVDAGKKYD